MDPRPPWRSLLGHALLAAAVAAFVFLLACDFFATWDGRAASAGPVEGDRPTRAVLIVEEARAIQRRWPAELVAELALPVDPMLLPPAEVVPEDRPETRKRRFSLGFLVEAPTGWRTVPTTSPQAFGLAVLVFVGLVGLRNMVVAGAPWLVAPRERYRPEVQRSGQVTSKRYVASKQAPPPPRPMRGRGRRG